MDRIEITPFAATAAAWDAALAALAPAAPVQAHAGYGAIAASSGRGLRRLQIHAGGRLVGLAQVLGRGGLWLCSRGPVFAADLPEVTRRQALRALARVLPGVLIATPEMPVAGFGLVPLVTARHQAIWDLTPEEGALRAGLQGKWRNRLVAAERAGLRVRVERAAGWLIAAEAQQRADRGYRALPPAFAEAWAQQSPGSALVLSAGTATAPRLAGVMVLRAGAGASYHLGWSGPEGRAAGAHNLLLWQAALRLRGMGLRSFDLGDINSEAGAGLMHFKLGTGASVHRLGATCLVLPG
ncbi:GNAT family N-acetyltransferase [Rhodobacter capsulatus]|uniref:GNAT family N-acetyltransferase n=1 Tax=Rhodobacter capsulatus TaxID=1061 RepID=UPI00402521EC